MVLTYSHRIPRVLCYSGTLLASAKHFVYGTVTLFRETFQNLQLCLTISLCCRSVPQWYFYLWFGLLPVRSPLLGQSLNYFLFLQVLRCFSSLSSLLHTMYSCARYCKVNYSVFPHSEIYGSKTICVSP